jgi:hypothetical protein
VTAAGAPRAAPAASWTDACFDFMARDAAGAESKLRTFRTVLFMIVAGEQYVHGETATAFVVLVCLAASFVRPLARVAVVVTLVLLARIALGLFPGTANHLYLELIALGCLAIADPDDPADARLLLATLRWITVLVFFYTGLQKLLYGQYFDARFFAYYSTHYEHFRVLHGLLSEQDAAMLRRFAEDLRLGVEDTGPYLVRSPALIALSNLAWMSELGTALLLFLPATRKWGVPFAILVMVGIESVARELLFGILMLDLILLFVKRDVGRYLVPSVAIVLLAIVAMKHELISYVTYF